MKLAENHPSLTTSYECQQLCNPLKKYDINYFHYAKVEKNVGYGVVSNPDWHQHVFESELPASTNLAELESGIYFWENIYPNKLMHDAHSEFSISNPVVKLFNYGDYYEVFAFASNPSSPLGYEWYFNQQTLLNEFIANFLHQGKSLIEECSKTPIILPSPMQAVSFENYYEKFKRSSTSNPICKYNLSKREVSCLVLLATGMTASEIAENLFLSRRTVECYIDKLKFKTGFNSRAELVALVINTPLLDLMRLSA